MIAFILVQKGKMGSFHGQLVTTLIEGVLIVPFDPHKSDLVFLIYFQETEPQIGVFLPFKAFVQPVEHPPFVDRIGHIT